MNIRIVDEYSKNDNLNILYGLYLLVLFKCTFDR